MVNPEGGYFPEPGRVWGELWELWESSGGALGSSEELWGAGGPNS